jgi:hypothetical protein
VIRRLAHEPLGSPTTLEVVVRRRNIVERAFNKLRGSRAVAIRYDKRDFVYGSTIDVASIESGSETRLPTIHRTAEWCSRTRRR